MTATATTGFRRGIIRVCLGWGQGQAWRTVDAWIKGEWAAHRMITGMPWNDDHISYDGLGGGYSVTLIPTGLKIYTFDKLAQAKRFICELPSLGLPPIADIYGADGSAKWDDAESQKHRDAVRGLIRKIEGRQA